MRISTAHAYDATIDSLSKRMSDLTATQSQISTNQRVNKASDDPTAAARAERANARLQTNDANQRALGMSKNAMTLSESALGSATDLLTTARDAMVAAGNGSYTASDRQTLVNTLTDARKQLLAVANTDDGSGHYLFAGQGTSALPFVDAPGGVVYHGADGEQQVASGEPLPTTVDGAVTWMQAPTGNGTFATSAVTSNGTGWIDRGSVTNPSAITGSDYRIQFSVASGATTYSVLKDGVATSLSNVAYTPGRAISIDGRSFTISGQPANGDEFEAAKSTQSQSVFDALDKAIAALKNPNANSGQIQQAVSGSIGDIDQSLTRLSSVRSEVGATLNRIDSVAGRLADSKVSDQTDHSNAVDLDMAAAISAQSTQQTNYEVALKAYATIQKLSLFNYIN